MELLQHVGKDWRMDKVMLTVFKSEQSLLDFNVQLADLFNPAENEQAVNFYDKLGWLTDEIDPSFYGRTHADYRILSKPCE